jgi:hypothetical protein
MTTPADVAPKVIQGAAIRLMERNAALSRELATIRANMKNTVREVRHRALSASLRDAAHAWGGDPAVRAWLIERAERIESEEPEP